MWSTRLPDYSVSGDSDTTVFLLHGLYGSREYWKFVTQRLLARGLRVVAWDAPGYGQSPLDPDYSLMSAADKCARLIGKTGTARNIVFGHSMGGQTAMRVNQKIPGLVSAVIITATIGYIGNKSPEEQKEFVNARKLDDTQDSDVMAKNLALVTGMMAKGASGPDVDLVKIVAASTPKEAVQLSVNAVKNSTDKEAIDALQSIRVPALIVAGAEDKVGEPAAMQRIAKMVDNSQFATVPGTGHYPWAEAPDAFFKILNPFLDRVLV
jgi:pimeloyl-ACP methyl ester carboxylesterase